MLSVFFWMCGLPFECGQPTRSHTINRTQQPLSQELPITNNSLVGVGFCAHFSSPCWSGLRLSKSCVYCLKCCEFLCAGGTWFLEKINDLVKAISIGDHPASSSMLLSLQTWYQNMRWTEVCLCEGVYSWLWVCSINGWFYPYSFTKDFQSIVWVNIITRTKKTLRKSRANKNKSNFSTICFIYIQDVLVFHVSTHMASLSLVLRLPARARESSSVTHPSRWWVFGWFPVS